MSLIGQGTRPLAFRSAQAVDVFIFLWINSFDQVCTHKPTGAGNQNGFHCQAPNAWLVWKLQREEHNSVSFICLFESFWIGCHRGVTSRFFSYLPHPSATERRFHANLVNCEAAIAVPLL
jgi:hypothetical protein